MRQDAAVHRLLLVLVAALVAAPTASAAGILDRAAAQLRTDPVYVDTGARKLVPPAAERRIEREIENARAGPVYVVVLPEAAAREAGGDPVEALRTIAQTLHRRGTYAGLIGNHFRALSNVLAQGEAGKLATEAFQAHHDQGAAATLVDFVDRVAAARNGSSSSGGTPWTLIVVIALVAGIAFFVVRSNRRKKQAQLGAVKQVAREDLVALAEDVQGLEHRVEGNAKARDAYNRALASYERASGSFDQARSPQQLSSVAEALDEGRYEMAVAEAELEGRTPPERRPPCFFDPRHGPSTRDVEWAPPGGTPRPVPACEADAQRVERGEDPSSRQVPVGGAMVPYWSTPMYGGYFGGFLPGLLIGGSLGGWGGAPVVAGDDTSDGGFDSGDFGGGGFGGGDFGGGGGGDSGGGGDF
jgi:uncharacterized membrane protein YgcG